MVRDISQSQIGSEQHLRRSSKLGSVFGQRGSHGYGNPRRVAQFTDFLFVTEPGAVVLGVINI